MINSISIENGDIVYIDNNLRDEVLRLTECYIIETKTKQNSMTFYLKELLEKPFKFSIENVKLELLDISRLESSKYNISFKDENSKLSTIYLRNFNNKLNDGISKVISGDKVTVTIISTYGNNNTILEISGDNFQILEL